LGDSGSWACWKSLDASVLLIVHYRNIEDLFARLEASCPGELAVVIPCEGDRKADIMGKTATWVLTDVKSGVWTDALRITPESAGLGGAGNWSIMKRTLHGGLCEGVDVIEVNNGALSFILVPTRGMGLWKGRYEGCEIGWQSPVTGPVNPMFVNPEERGGLGWLKGFDESIVRCGLSSNGTPARDIVPDNNGNPVEVAIPLHGAIANLPATHVEATVEVRDGATWLEVSGVVEEGMLFCPCLTLKTRFTTCVGSNSVAIHDEVINRNAVEREMQLLYHCNFGEPFLEEGSRLVLPALESAPRDARAAETMDNHEVYLGPTPGYVEQAYYHRLAADRHGNTLTLLRNRAGDKGVAVRFNVRQLPCFTQWKNTVGRGDGYVTGLEPGTNFPNAKPFERGHGRVVTLKPGGCYQVDLAVEILASTSAVADAVQQIGVLRGVVESRIYPQPMPLWSPAAG